MLRRPPFFSTDDWFIGTTPMNAGIPEAIRQLTVTFRYGDLAGAAALFEQHPGRIAALILEPARTEDPPAGYLHALQRLCHAHGALLILDEMITGFRWHTGGAQKLYGIVPDLSTFGKAFANGFSVSRARRPARVHAPGRARSPRPAARVPALDHARRRDPCARGGDRDHAGVPVRGRDRAPVPPGRAPAPRHRAGDRAPWPASRSPCCLSYATLDQDGRPSQALRTLFLQETIRRGVLMPSLVVSYSHTDADIDLTIEAIDQALAVYRQALDHGVERYRRPPLPDRLPRRNLPEVLPRTRTSARQLAEAR